MHDTQFPESTPWYKTPGGISFLGFLGVLFVLFIIFSGFVGYYAYQIRQGNGDQIVKQIQQAKGSFTASPTIDTNTQQVAQDPTQFIRSHDPQFGNQQSPVKIVAFLDFECPFSQQEFDTF